MDYIIDTVHSLLADGQQRLPLALARLALVSPVLDPTTRVKYVSCLLTDSLVYTSRNVPNFCLVSSRRYLGSVKRSHCLPCDAVELHVLGRLLTYYGQIVTNAEARFNVALRPQKP